jgi:hypothetical protein
MNFGNLFLKNGYRGLDKTFRKVTTSNGHDTEQKCHDTIPLLQIVDTAPCC